jgi:protein-disulfide isomerase
MDKRFLGILVLLVAIFIGFLAFSGGSSKNGGGGSNGKAQPSNHVTGNNTKGVTLLEYGDFQCPICEIYYSPVKEVTQRYQNDIHFQFRNLPLTSIHPNAFSAARAAEAAAMQNKYWEMHDTLYDNTNWQNWTRSQAPLSFFTTYAQQLGLDVNKFKTDYASSQVNDTINADLAAFNKTGQQMATPTFFINGKYVSNDQLADSNGPSVDKFSKVIEDAIAAQTSSNQSQ